MKNLGLTLYLWTKDGLLHNAPAFKSDPFSSTLPGDCTILQQFLKPKIKQNWWLISYKKWFHFLKPYCYLLLLWITTEAHRKGHPWDLKKVSITGAGHLWECKNTRICMGVEKNGVFMKEALTRAVRLGECPLEDLLLYMHQHVLLGFL